MCKRIFLIFFLTTICLNLVFSRQKDSLLAVLDTAKNEHKVKVLNELFRANIQSDPIKAIGYTR